MVSGSRGRKGQAVIEDIKTVAIVLITLFVIGAIIGILAIVGGNLNQGFAHVDGARLHSGVTSLIGENNAATGVHLLNDYAKVETSGDTLRLRADFLDDALEVELPSRYTYSGELSGKEICIVKQGDDFTFREPPCG